MAQKEEIVSRALVMLGANPISSFAEGTEGELATLLYETTYRAMLSDYPWRFAIKKQKLGRLEEQPLNSWEYQFQLPTDIIVVFNVDNQRNYEIYEDKLYANIRDIEIDYISRIDETLLPSHFEKALEYELASQFAVPLTDNSQRATYYAQRAEDSLRRARRIDSQSRPSVPIQNNVLLSRSRVGGPFFFRGAF